MAGQCADTGCDVFGERLCCRVCTDAAEAHLVEPERGKATRAEWTAYYDERDRLGATQMRCARHHDQHCHEVHGAPKRPLSPGDFDRLEAARQEWECIRRARANANDPGSVLYTQMLDAHRRYLVLRDELEPGWRDSR